MRSPSFFRFLARSLALLEDEIPWAYRVIAERLGTREVQLRVDDEVMTVKSAPPRLRLSPSSVAPSVRLRTTRRAILGLIDGRESLVDAILADRIELVGSVGDLVAFHDGLMAYLHAAVRCSSFAELRDEYVAEPVLAGRRSIELATPGGFHVEVAAE